MGYNRVEYDGNVLIDLMGDTVTPEDVKPGIVFHDRSGLQQTGTADWFPMTPEHYDYHIGYINNGSWIYENPTNTYTDIYAVQAGHQYRIQLGATVGTRFRAMFTTRDVTTVTSGNVAGTQIINQNNPAAYAVTQHKPASDGYILVAKDNVGHSGLKSYVHDLTGEYL